MEPVQYYREGDWSSYDERWTQFFPKRSLIRVSLREMSPVFDALGYSSNAALDAYSSLGTGVNYFEDGPVATVEVVKPHQSLRRDVVIQG